MRAGDFLYRRRRWSQAISSLWSFQEPGATTTTDLTYPLAELDGVTVWAASLAARTDRPTGLTCVGCGGAMTLRAGEHRRPHFAHRPGTACVSGESALHALAIRAVADGVMNSSRQRAPYSMVIRCDFCDASRLADLARESGLIVDLNRAVAPEARPDILVRSSTGEPLFVIEVVVTHAPEPSALDAFKRLRLPVIAVRPTWETLEGLRDGLVGLDAKVGAPTPGSVGLLSDCRLPRHLGADSEELRPCAECGADSRVLTLEVVDAKCHRCSSQSRALDVHLDNDGRRVAVAAGAKELSGITAVAREMNVVLEERYSKRADVSYLANICACGAFQGDNFVYEGFSSEQTYETDLATPVRHYEVCRSGHWRLLAERPWPSDSRVRRRVGARGLCGAEAGIFDNAESLMSVKFFDPSTVSPLDIARALIYGRRKF